MGWKEKCTLDLMRRDLFLSVVHLERFQNMFELVKDQAYFTRGVCKCLFLMTWEPGKAQQMKTIFEEMNEQENPKIEYLIQKSDEMFQNTGCDRAMKNLFLDFLLNEDETPDENVLVGFSVTRIAIGDNSLEMSRALDRLSLENY